MSFYYKQKTWVLTSACSTSRLSTALVRKQAEKHPRGSIQYTVKCALRNPVPLAHYGEYMLHPVAAISAFVFAYNGKVLISIVQKQSAT